MEPISLDVRARELLDRAAAASSGRAADTVHGGHEHGGHEHGGHGQALRQTLLALTAGTGLAEHESPGEATLLVLRGHVRLSSGDASWEGRAGDLLAVPGARHALDAVEDSAVLLTVVRRP
ncbi:cupin domain-containing protein [Microbispora triticiradicis]|uniref:LuxR family transcriptional regulator n=2 Tax=Microbispora TaxID=2005 RepID=A0ABY3LPK3_9ACTN|nr:MULTISPECIES: cupin domain-containing protein [Microbispora]TLP59804.1 LuxR family transcriptional regulator [Microbispora fusca]TYB45811.1 LuxR family transcriptional regulator [Microbispora tritici]